MGVEDCQRVGSTSDFLLPTTTSTAIAILSENEQEPAPSSTEVVHLRQPQEVTKSQRSLSVELRELTPFYERQSNLRDLLYDGELSSTFLQSHEETKSILQQVSSKKKPQNLSIDIAQSNIHLASPTESTQLVNNFYTQPIHIVNEPVSPFQQNSPTPPSASSSKNLLLSPKCSPYKDSAYLFSPTPPSTSITNLNTVTQSNFTQAAKYLPKHSFVEQQALYKEELHREECYHILTNALLSIRNELSSISQE